MQKEEVVKAVEAFGNHLKEKLGDSMVASLIYGSLVKGDYDAESSDHNVALILKDDQATTLRAVAGAMRAKRPSRKTGLLLLTTDEIARARDVFPLKIRDIARHHQVVVGDDGAVKGLEFKKADLARDCEQQLRSLMIRLRRLFIRGESSLDMLRTNLVASYKGFLPPAAGLVELINGEEPKTKAEIVTATSKALDCPAKPLESLKRWATDSAYAPAEAEVNEILNGYAGILRGAANKADSFGGE